MKRARRLRREMSLPEVLLWRELRKRPAGLKFRRQFPIGQMTVDFVCLERRIALEVDGEGHGFGDQPRRDAARDAILRRSGFAVLRLPARDVLRDLDAVLRHVVATCSVAGSSPERGGEPAKPVAGSRASTPHAPEEFAPRSAMGPLHHRSDGPPPRSGEDLGSSGTARSGEDLP
ncbi:MAG TPA: endonuclease domain-containing protein [Sphingomicrobium sp.]|nr:endonuclease domain-containing protein [Sphingomicrobium sp.]